MNHSDKPRAVAIKLTDPAMKSIVGGAFAATQIATAASSISVATLAIQPGRNFQVL